MFYVLCSELLQEGDRKLDDQFLELERKLLEKALRASSDDPASSSDDSASSQNPPEASSRTASFSLSSSSGTKGPPSQSQLGQRPGQTPPEEQSKVVVAEWWTMGQNCLMDGALAELKSDFEPLYQGTHMHAAHELMCITAMR